MTLERLDMIKRPYVLLTVHTAFYGCSYHRQLLVGMQATVRQVIVLY